MEPIDGPRIILVRAECVGHMRRNQDVLVAVDGESLSLDAVPTFTFGTIDQHGVICTLVLLHIMILDTGKIAYLAHIERSDKRLLAIVFQ